jgi:hypothetical protein
MTTPSEEGSLEVHEDEIDMLRRVLEPLGGKRSEHLIALTRDYLENVSPLTWCAAQSEPGEPDGAAVWQLGAPSPLNGDRVVFALFYDPDARCVVAYSFSAVKQEGFEGAVAIYHREYIYRPRYGTGPIALDALYNDLTFHLTAVVDDEEPDPPHRSNGA